MATTTYDDNAFSVRAIASRTNSGGTPVTDITAEEDRLAVAMLTPGWLIEEESFLVKDGLAGTWTVTVGSDGSRADYYIVEGEDTGQGNYLVRLAAKTTVTTTAANPTLNRYDEIYLVVEDDAYDTNGRSLARIAVRTGDAAVSPSLPGADAGWSAYELLATIYVPAGAADIVAASLTPETQQTQLLVDAATLEGHAASYFAEATHDHDLTYADIAHVDSTDGHPVATASLDGLLDSAYKAKLDNIEASADANETGAEIVAGLLPVDGNGSGLDADLLDGLQGSALATAGHLHNTDYYLESEINSQVADKRNKPEAVFLKQLSAVGTTHNVASVVPVSTEERDDWGGHSGTTALVYTDAIGYYMVAYQVAWEANTSGIRQLRLYQSNPSGRTLAIHRVGGMTGGELTIINGSFMWYGAAATTQYVALEQYQTSGSNINIEPNLTWFRVMALGN